MSLKKCKLQEIFEILAFLVLEPRDGGIEFSLLDHILYPEPIKIKRKPILKGSWLPFFSILS